MKNYILMMRPRHWSKNIFVFAALLFGGKLIAPADEVFLAILSASAAFVCFSLASAAIYIFSDIIDRNKLTSPDNMISAGKVSLSASVLLAIVCTAVAMAGAFMLVNQLAVVLGAYIVLMGLYVILFRSTFILDVIIVAISFVLCAMAGAIVIGAFISKWLIICTFSLCLFLGFGKRRGQLATLTVEQLAVSKELKNYTVELLGHMLDITGALTIICFLLYSLDDRTVEFFGTSNLIYTMPFVLYGVFRFSWLIQKGHYADPLELLFADRPFQVAIGGWLFCSIFIIYAGRIDIDSSGILAY